MVWNSGAGGACFLVSGAGAGAASRSAELDGETAAGSRLPARVGAGFLICSAGSGGGDFGCGSGGCGVSSSLASVFSSGPDMRGGIGGCGGSGWTCGLGGGGGGS